MKDWLPTAAAVVGLAVIVIVILSVIFLVGQWASDQEHARRVDSFKNHCIEAGGHIYEPQFIFCLDESGRMLEVYP